MSDHDLVDLPHRPIAQLQPDRLAVLGALFGMTPGIPTRCRVLELGCGSAASLIPMADLHPASRFVGVDLSPTAIGQGRRRIAALDLPNLRLDCMDLMDLPPDAGEFDYIIAHGLFSRVEAPLRAGILQICRRHLAPQGIAYISYEAYPGSYVTKMWRDIMLFHTAQFADRQHKIDQARSIVHLVALGTRRADAEHRLAREEHARLSSLSDASIYHEELAPIWQPFLFHEFMSLAQAHDLQYVAEASYRDMQPDGISGNAAQLLRTLEAADRIRYEQYLDFFRMRHYRQTLLCGRAAMLRSAPDLSVMTRFRYSAPLCEMPADSSATPPDAQAWRNEQNGVTATTNDPVGLGALAAIADAWPATVSFGEIAATAGGRDKLCRILHAYYASGLIHAGVVSRPAVRAAGDHPQVWRVARTEAGLGSSIPNLHLGTIELQDQAVRRLLPLFDGCSARAELEAAVGGPDALQTLLADMARKALLIS